MGHGRYIGRVGALALALGVGCAVALPVGTAAAETPASSSTPSETGGEASKETSTEAPTEAQSAQPSTTSAEDTPATPSAADDDQNDRSSPSAQTVEVAPGVVVSSSGGAQSSSEHDETDTEDQKEEDAGDDDNDEPPANADRSQSDQTTSANADPATRTPTVSAQTVERRRTIDDRSADGPVTEPQALVTAAAVASGTPATAGVATKRAAEVPRIATTAMPSPVSAVLRAAIAPIVAKLLDALPTTPTESPWGWLLLAAARRQIGVVADEPETAAFAAAEPTLSVTAGEDLPPSVGTPVFGTPNSVTGEITGQIVAADPEGTELSYAVTTAPAVGALDFDGTTAQFTYTPTATQRIQASVTPGADTIAMTVTVSDGAHNVPAVINIPLSAAPMTKLAGIEVTDPRAVVATETRAYVTNRAAGTVTVIDTTTNTVIGTIPVGPSPDQLVIKPNGSRLYVTSRDNNTVTVVDTATGEVRTTIQTAAPSAIAINASGSLVYVTNFDNGTMSKINGYTDTVAGIVALPAGLRPTGIVVSPDKTKIYVTSGTATGGAVAVIGYTSTRSTLIAEVSGAPTGLAVSPDNSRLYVTADDGSLTVVDTKTQAVVATHLLNGVPVGVAVSQDGTVLMVTDADGRVTALDAATGGVLRTLATRTSATPTSTSLGTAASPDGTRVYIADPDTDTVHVVSLASTNNAPTVGLPALGAPKADTGTVIGSLDASDPDGDTLTYTVTGGPANGRVLIYSSSGTFYYTPTATARHAASAVDAPASATTDSFTISVSDGWNDPVRTTITIDILPANRVPVVTATTGTPDTATGVVTGDVKATDGDWDVRTYTASTPGKGTVVISSTGAFTYTPTAQARHAAARLGATPADTSDTFTVTVDDGHGGVVPVTVTVAVSPVNAAPTGAVADITDTDHTTGTITGTVTATDADNDTFTYTTTTSGKGTITVDSDGTFTYTPTAAAREAAASADATPAAKIDTVTFTVSDGHGGTATVDLTLSIAPYSADNAAPTNGRATVNDPTLAIGAVTGTVAADDANNDELTFTLETGPTKGIVAIDGTTGEFVYVPDVESRYAAAATEHLDADVFTVGISDGRGGFTTTTVQVEVAPPLASAMDQRSTTVAVAAQEMYFYSQADTDRALDLLKAAGVTNIRILIPWAGVEPADDAWTWSAVDRMVNAAHARDIEVLGILNSTPSWVARPGMPPLSGYPTSPAEFAEYAGMVATRYAGKVSAYEIWNEPNYYAFWAPQPDAAQYTELLKAAYPVLKAADPDAVVVAGGVAHVPDFGTLAVDTVRFVEEMYEAGAAGYFDALSYHPYLWHIPFSEGGPHPTAPLNYVEQLHEIMVAHGDGNKKIWATEYGQPASLVSEASQSDYIGDFLRTWRELDYAGPAFIHTIRDYPDEQQTTATMGLFREDWTAKPALFTVEQVIEENEALLTAADDPSEVV